MRIYPFKTEEQIKVWNIKVKVYNLIKKVKVWGMKGITAELTNCGIFQNWSWKLGESSIIGL